jgi:hypothetical protein
VTLQARGKGLAPINTTGGSQSFLDWLAREGYTDIKWVEGKSNGRRAHRDADPPDARGGRRIVRTPRRR